MLRNGDIVIILKNYVGLPDRCVGRVYGYDTDRMQYKVQIGHGGYFLDENDLKKVELKEDQPKSKFRISFRNWFKFS